MCEAANEDALARARVPVAVVIEPQSGASIHVMGDVEEAAVVAERVGACSRTSASSTPHSELDGDHAGCW